jgi:hypothetical protein
MKNDQLRRRLGFAALTALSGVLLFASFGCFRVGKGGDMNGTAIAPQFEYSIEPVATVGINEDTLSVHSHSPIVLPHDGPLSTARHIGMLYPVSYLGFSRTGRFLAIEYQNGPMVIWDVKLRRERARFNATGGNGTKKLLWGPNDRFVTLGQAVGTDTFNVWDPATGKIIATPKGMAIVSALSPDGEKMVSFVGEDLNGVRTFGLRDYDTRSWNFITIPSSEAGPSSKPCGQWTGLSLYDIEWGNNGKFYVVGIAPSSASRSHCMGGSTEITPTGLFVKEIDPDNPQLPKTSYLDYSEERAPGEAPYVNFLSRTSFSPGTDVIAFSSGFTVDLKSLKLRPVNFDYDYIDSGQSAFSADGKLLYLLRSRLRRRGSPGSWGSGDEAGGVLDVARGQIVGSFAARQNFSVDGGVSASPDGKLLAATDGWYVNILRLK